MQTTALSSATREQHILSPAFRTTKSAYCNFSKTCYRFSVAECAMLNVEFKC